MAGTHTSALKPYQQPLWGPIDPLLKKCFAVSGTIGALLLIFIFVIPITKPGPLDVNDVPERLARLILEKPAPLAPAIKAPERVSVMETPKAEPVPEAAKPVTPPPAVARRIDKPRVAEDKGVQGRKKAQKEVTQNLAEVSGSLDKVLDNLSKSLPAADKSTSDNSDKSSRRRRRSVASGRSTQQLSSIGGVSSLSTPDMSSSAIQGDGISIAAISDLAVTNGPSGSGAPDATGSSTRGSTSEYRSNESLLAAVRRYAPGIQFCYDNELKKNPGLRGRLVVSITVLASGEISEAQIVEDSLGSPGVVNCVLAQIRGWRLPTVPHGVTSFKTPFVFTPPN